MVKPVAIRLLTACHFLLLRTFGPHFVVVVGDENAGGRTEEDDVARARRTIGKCRRDRTARQRHRKGGSKYSLSHVVSFSPARFGLTIRTWRRAGAFLETPFPVQTEHLIRAIPDFPIPGILFRDITPLLKDKQGFKEAIDLFVDRFKDSKIDYVVGIEARGYMLGAPLAYALGAGFVPVRKPGKLPYDKLTESYALEYGTNSLEIHSDALGHGERVVVVDDLLATGGTAAATKRLLERLGAKVEAFAFLIELQALKGREALTGVDIVSFVSY